MKTTKLSTMALATTIALGAVSGVAVSMNVNVEQAQAKTETLRAKADRQIYKKDGSIVLFQKIKHKQWYTVDSNAKTIKTKKGTLQPVRFMDKTVYITLGSYLSDLVDKG